MTPKNKKFIPINSISELFKLGGMPKPKHPLIGLTKLDDVTPPKFDEPISFILNFYIISLKRSVKGKFKYGQNYYDFDEGVLAFMEPGQILYANNEDNNKSQGWWLVFHPDFIRNYTLSKAIKEYGFFSYSVNEALHLSDKEEEMLEGIMRNIEHEYHTSIDHYSQDVMVSQLELLLNYSNRFYNRQFITRKSASQDLLVKLEDLLNEYFNGSKISESGLPTVQYFSAEGNVDWTTFISAGV